ncbi:MAG: hypothetical protein FJ304_06960 [Planctomycetes bacterium]|nr:hypothetical protein [Planctomycetota bacterium]
MSRLSVFAAAVVVLVPVSGCAEAFPDDKVEKVAGTLLAPTADQKVGREIRVKCNIPSVPKDHVIVAAVESNSLMWPKEPYLDNFKGDDYEATVAEGGDPGATFRITVLVVGKEGQKKLKKWFDTGRTTGDFPGLKLSDIPGAQRVDSVGVKFKS